MAIESSENKVKFKYIKSCMWLKNKLLQYFKAKTSYEKVYNDFCQKKTFGLLCGKKSILFHMKTKKTFFRVKLWLFVAHACLDVHLSLFWKKLEQIFLHFNPFRFQFYFLVRGLTVLALFNIWEPFLPNFKHMFCPFSANKVCHFMVDINFSFIS